MYKKTTVLFLIAFWFTTFLELHAQTRVLVLNNLDQISNDIITELNTKAKKYNIEFSFAKEPETSTLSTSSVVVFWKFDESKLDLRQNNLLIQYFKNKGGVLILPGNLKLDYRWIWFENFVGKKIYQDNPVFSGDLISFLSGDYASPSPIFNVANAKFEISKSGNIKPLIIDFGNTVFAYLKTTEFGNKLFYLGLEPNISLLNNQDFEKALFGGIQNVIDNANPKQELSVNLPRISQFKADTLLSFDFQPKFLIKSHMDNYFIIGHDGELVNYHHKTGGQKLLGTYNQLKNIPGISPDTEFETNSYLYYFQNNTDNKVLAKRLKVDSIVIFDDFEQYSSLPRQNFIELSGNESTTFDYKLPEYYKNKTLTLNSKGEIMSLEYGKQNTIINQEPFVWNIDSVKAITLCEDKNLMVLTQKQLLKIQYDTLGHFVPNIQMSYQLEKTPKGLILNLRAYSDMNAEFEWTIENKTFIGKEVKYVSKTTKSIFVLLKAKTLEGKEKVASQMIQLK